MSEKKVFRVGDRAGFVWNGELTEGEVINISPERILIVLLDDGETRVSVPITDALRVPFVDEE